MYGSRGNLLPVEIKSFCEIYLNSFNCFSDRASQKQIQT